MPFGEDRSRPCSSYCTSSPIMFIERRIDRDRSKYRNWLYFNEKGGTSPDSLVLREDHLRPGPPCRRAGTCTHGCLHAHKFQVSYRRGRSHRLVFKLPSILNVASGSQAPSQNRPAGHSAPKPQTQDSGRILRHIWRETEVRKKRNRSTAWLSF